MKATKLTLLCALVFSFLMTSCRKEDEPKDRDLAVQFKITATENVNVKSAVVQVGTEQSINYQVAGQSWTSESQIVNTSAKYLKVASTADAFDENSQLIVQIWVDGKLEAADTAKVMNGSMNLIAEKSLNFHDL